MKTSTRIWALHWRGSDCTPRLKRWPSFCCPGVHHCRQIHYLFPASDKTHQRTGQGQLRAGAAPALTRGSVKGLNGEDNGLPPVGWEDTSLIDSERLIRCLAKGMVRVQISWPTRRSWTAPIMRATRRWQRHGGTPAGDPRRRAYRTALQACAFLDGVDSNAHLAGHSHFNAGSRQSVGGRLPISQAFSEPGLGHRPTSGASGGGSAGQAWGRWRRPQRRLERRSISAPVSTPAQRLRCRRRADHPDPGLDGLDQTSACFNKLTASGRACCAPSDRLPAPISENRAVLLRLASRHRLLLLCAHRPR